MPFITSSERDALDSMIDNLSHAIKTQGQRAYVVYRLAFDPNIVRGYTSISKARAILKDTFDILTVRLLRYEDEKEKENGGI